MKKTFKILIAVTLFSVLQFSVSYAQDAEYNLIRRTYKVNGDGTMDISYRKEIKLLRNRAITAYADKGETFILYNPAIDRLTINESYTIRKDGSRVQTPANAFIDQLPSQCENCGRYNGIRERVVVHTALEYDCIVVLDYTIHRKTNQLYEVIRLSEDCPVKKYEVIYDVPNNYNGYYDVLSYNGISSSTKIKTINDNHTYHCVATNLSQNYNDSYLPSYDELYPHVILIFGMRNFEYIEDEGVPAAANLVGELHDNDPLKYVTNIRDYVFDNIRTTDFPLALINYRVSPAQETFLSGCGTPDDKYRLATALMREAGFQAEDEIYDENRNIIVTINEQNGEMKYVLSMTDKRPARLEGAAVDEQRTIETERSLAWQGETIGNGYAVMTLPTERGSINIDPARLTSNRKAPVKIRNCNEKYHYTLTLPSHAKLVKPVNISYTQKGVGNIKICIKQLDNRTLDVVRELNINVEDGIVMPKQYKAFRQMMQDWGAYRKITIKH